MFLGVKAWLGLGTTSDDVIQLAVIRLHITFFFKIFNNQLFQAELKEHSVQKVPKLPKRRFLNIKVSEFKVK
jgi:hypothetical protein